MKEGWVYKTLGECCDINYGTRVVRQKDGGTIYDVYGGGGATFKMDIFNREDCVVLARFAMSKQCTRYVSGKFYLNDSGLTVSPKTDSRLSQLLLNKLLLALNDTIYSYGRGSAQRNLNVKEFIKIPIAFPKDVTDQQRIVTYLDAEFAKIEALKANAEKQLQAAKDLFQAALKELLTPKDGWVEKKLVEICAHIVDCPHTTPKKVTQKTNYPCIRTSELKNGTIYWDSMQYLDEKEYLKRISRLVPQADDIVYGREGTFGDAVLLPKGYKFSLGQRTMLLRPTKEIVSPKYLHYEIISPHVYAQAQAKNTGCGVPHVNVADVKQFRICYPPNIPEQQQIANKLDTISAKVKALQSNYTETITLCNDLKQALLKKVFE